MIFYMKKCVHMFGLIEPNVTGFSLCVPSFSHLAISQYLYRAYFFTFFPLVCKTLSAQRSHWIYGIITIGMVHKTTTKSQTKPRRSLLRHAIRRHPNYIIIIAAWTNTHWFQWNVPLNHHSFTENRLVRIGRSAASSLSQCAFHVFVGISFVIGEERLLEIFLFISYFFLGRWNIFDLRVFSKKNCVWSISATDVSVKRALFLQWFESEKQTKTRKTKKWNRCEQV